MYVCVCVCVMYVCMCKATEWHSAREASVNARGAVLAPGENDKWSSLKKEVERWRSTAIYLLASAELTWGRGGEVGCIAAR